MKPPSDPLARAADHTEAIIAALKVESVRRARRVLGKAVHPDAVSRLFELWPQARVFVKHTIMELTPEEVFKGGTRRIATMVWIVKYPDDPDSPRVMGIAIKHPNDHWDRRRGIELAFRRALGLVRSHELDLTEHPGKREEKPFRTPTLKGMP
jgi:hypothetical protein